MKSKSKIVQLSIIVSVLTNLAYAKDMKDLKTVTITAQKVEDNLQNIPMSVSVVDAYDIEDNNIENLKDISNTIPNFTSIDSGINYVYIPTIRGIYANPARTNPRFQG